MNGLLIFVAVVFWVCAFIGYKQGLVKIVASLLATVIMIALVMVLTPYVSKVIRQVTPLEETIQNKIGELVTAELGAEVPIPDIQIPREQQISLIENAKLPEVFRKMLLENNNEEAYASLGVSSFGEYVGAYIAKVISDVAAFLLVMVLILIIVPILIKMLGIFNKLPVIGGMNRLAGGVLGLAIGLAVVWVSFIIITLMYSTEFGSACFACIEQSAILQKLYDGNILMNAITKF